MKSCGTLIEQEEKRRGARYDWVVISRTDLFWLREGPRLEDLQSKRAVYVSCDKAKRAKLGGCYRDCGGVRDGHFIIARENAWTFLVLWDAISHNSPVLKILANTYFKNIESFIFESLKHQKVPLMRYAPGFIKSCSKRKIDNTLFGATMSDSCTTCKFQNISFLCRSNAMDLDHIVGSSLIEGSLKMRFFKDSRGR